MDVLPEISERFDAPKAEVENTVDVTVTSATALSAAQIQELAFDYLDAPVARVGAPFSPVPFSPALEASYVPNAKSIAAEARRTLGL